MWKVTLKGIWAKKVRFLLTGIAVILGVAFISGTFVLTATISKTFDGLFTDIYENTDAVVRAEGGSSTARASVHRSRARSTASCCPRSAAPRVSPRPPAAVQGFAVIVDKNGDALGSTGKGAPTLGFALHQRPRPEHARTSSTGRVRAAPNQIVIDKGSADEAGYKIGDTVPVSHQDRRSGVRAHRHRRSSATANSLLGATIAAFTPDDRDAACSGTPGKFDEIGVKADAGVSEQEVVRNIRADAGGRARQRGSRCISGDGRSPTESQNNLKDNLVVLQHVPAGLRRDRAARRLVHHLQHVLDHRRPTQPRAGAAARDRRRAAPGDRLGAARSRPRRPGRVGRIGFVGRHPARRRRLKALLAGLGRRHPGGVDRRSPRPPLIWSFVVGIVVTVVAAVAPALRAARIPPIAAMRDADVDSSSTSPASARCIGHRHHARRRRRCCCSGSSATAASCSYGRPRHGRRVPRRRGPRPDDRRVRSAAALGLPIQRFKGITGLLARGERDAQPEAHVGDRRRADDRCRARRADHRLRRIGALVGRRRASTSSMKADYIVRSGGLRRGPDPAGGRTAARRRAAGVESVSGMRSGADRGRRLGHPASTPSIRRRRLAVRPRTRARDRSPTSVTTVWRCRTRSTTTVEARRQGPGAVPADGPEGLHRAAIFDQAGLSELHHQSPTRTRRTIPTSSTPRST